ncbi:unnamed protein product [Effrenium voratum]|uniref:Uncharacterized protein n=1 Tax=Effrenium voratum TaxID=2562239 RepID=A0AA36MMP8_9DINO|nr:unnamed protein product [Effrenium voratum]
MVRYRLQLCPLAGRLQRQPWLLCLCIPLVALSLLLLADVSGMSAPYFQPEPEAEVHVPVSPIIAQGRPEKQQPLTEAPTPKCQAGSAFQTKLEDFQSLRAAQTADLVSPWPGNVPEATLQMISQGVKRKVAASIAVHPPKYYALVMFLAEWLRCPAAFEALSIYVVFQFKQDLKLFREAVACIIPGTPEVWVPIIASEPKKGWMKNVGLGNQYTAAFKKYYGLAAIMDLGQEEYGLMLDAEISLFDLHAKASSGSACSSTGAWSRLLPRIQSVEQKKVWPGARVSSTLTQYNFGTFTKSGKDYDLHLLRENARFVNFGTDVTDRTCKPDTCKKILHQLKHVIWTWWTDLPWVRLDVAKRMMAHLAKTNMEEVTSWRQVAQRLFFPRFEYVLYQMWTMLYDGWDIRDVTNITKEAKWGSYLEDPQHGSRLAELRPMWASAETVLREEEGKIASFSEEEPPVLIFHVDHEGLRYSFGGQEYKELWEQLLLELLTLHKRVDYNAENIH